MLLKDDALYVDIPQLKKAAGVIRAFRNKKRHKILSILDANKGITVTELHTKLKTDQPTASFHLAILRKAGIVIKDRDSKYSYYSINYKKVAELMKRVDDFLKE
jgi:DNA-binding transcriptional ArsR family regulator